MTQRTPDHQPFLRQVAETYVREERENLLDFCFVFPNKRSATFFSSFIDKAMGNTAIPPATTTISEFVASFSDLVEANRYEQIFTLFKAYSSLPGVDIEFDKFLFWGEMIINDFNDVDRYLVNPEALFVNLTRLREISSNYLTEEQIKAIARFWGEESPHQHPEHFWNHIQYPDDENKSKNKQDKFLKLWEVMLDLYNTFNARLEERGLASPGRLYRNAADRLRSTDANSLMPFRRYIFVGFNVLSTSEIEIFQRLKARGMADFYWDFNSPALRVADNRARRFITRNMEDFPSLYDLPEKQIDTIPNIKILGIPSFTGQVKAAAMQLSEWLDSNDISDPDNAVDTAIVLPDENLFIPMIHSVPEKITSMNVTMGFPLKLSPIASIMKSVISLQLRSRKLHGERTFFYEDVKPLLVMPIIRNADPEGVDKLADDILKRRLYQIEAREIARQVPAIEPVFTALGNLADIESVETYVESLCDFLARNADPDDRMSRHFIEAYRCAVKRLCQAARGFGIDMTGFALFHLVERSVNSDSVNFVGEPLAGLQIMGVLETRALDFRNVIMLSMNERVFPRKHYTKSFIPDTLRKAYGMATLDFQESIYAYYFYRLLSRARNATLIYDARRVGGSRPNEMSRYLAQLLYMFGDKNVSHKLGLYSAVPSGISGVSIAKNDRIMKLLSEFTPEGGTKNLSASAIKAYISCPLNFYLQYVEGFNADNEITDYVDSSTFGTIVHTVMERFYRNFQQKDENGNPKPVEIRPEMLDPFINAKPSVELERLITTTINHCFNHYPEERLLTPLVGETKVLGHIFYLAVIEMLKHDRSLAPFTFVAAEYSMKGTLDITPDFKVNVKQIIDRIDIVNGQMRFVDYKTGGDLLKTTTIESLFDGEKSDYPKAIMQLMVYCHIYRCLENYTDAIQPVIYKMLTLKTDGIQPIVVAKKELTDYRSIYNDFVEIFNEKVLEIFNPEVPFRQTTQTHNCTFCNFKSICSREHLEKY